MIPPQNERPQPGWLLRCLEQMPARIGNNILYFSQVSYSTCTLWNQVCRVCATRCWHESFSFDDVSGHKTRDISPQGKREIRRIRTLARSQEEHLDRPRPRDAGRARSLEPSPVGCRGSVDSTITAAGRCNKMAIIGGWISSPYGPYCDRSRMGILETLPFRSGFA
jgi:hypothetical protein